MEFEFGVFGKERTVRNLGIGIFEFGNSGLGFVLIFGVCAWGLEFWRLEF